MAANLQQQRAINEQLQREADIPRMSVSEASSLMIKYVSEHENEDCLLSGFSNQKVNPFREKSSCGIL
ncbi:guanine nucleotide-binding protein subunit gamma-1-like [Episyrphus balteatus]|uniref:guanine nucleotide-binding protein subunit gamma-1-like n=1 Tax=Episyrphus balteatus TaxID=286459 RepID=UPI0024859CF4|nr:guanine nucleotide-binding protein subunit gamma-1-like [Episyrphus balteatus]XP_055855665.1 guanine nucleotide-binding protein subunit gamma-1-like [Episyrphus balteatus]